VLCVESPNLIRELVAEAIFSGFERIVSCTRLESYLQSIGVTTFVEIKNLSENRFGMKKAGLP
jgi:hypothetical protein